MSTLGNRRIIAISRIVAAGLGLTFALPSLGGFIAGFATSNGHFFALASLTSGLALACYVWWSFTGVEAHTTGSNWVLLAVLALASGLAAYSNLAWGLWALGLPMAIGTVRNNIMAEHYWLGPVSLLYAVVCYVSLKWHSRPRKTK